jgi:hypothetical protein
MDTQLPGPLMIAGLTLLGAALILHGRFVAFPYKHAAHCGILQVVNSLGSRC